MSIIISRDGKNAVRLERTVIEREDYLQRYIYANPDALPLDELKEDLRLLVLAREFQTTSGPIDALGIDADGELYLIETKLYKNSDKRAVVAQVLDYGASLWKMHSDPADFLIRLEQSVQNGLGKSLNSAVVDFFQLDDVGYRELLESINRNIDAGVFHFIVLMDRMDERLKHLISFVNTKANFDIIGVELDYYQHDEFEIIIPNLYGVEAKKESVSSGTARRTWDKDQFFQDARDRLSASEVAALDKLYESVSRSDAHSWGTGGKRGSFNAKFDRISPKSVFSVFSDGDLVLNLEYIRSTPSSAQIASDLASKLRDDGFAIAADSEHPRIGRKEWTTRVDTLLAALDRVFQPHLA